MVLRQLAWAAFKKVASNPRVQEKAVDVVRDVDRRMDEAAEKAVRATSQDNPDESLLNKADNKINAAAERVGKVAASDDPAREIGRAIGKFFSDK